MVDARKRSFFVALDGGDGVGKSSQAAELVLAAERLGVPVCACRDPGTTRLGERIRAILLNSEGMDISPMSETLLFMAARAQMVEEVVLPALNEGKLVVTDRFFLSTVVYQGYAGGLPPDEVMAIGMPATQGVFPDLTVVLDIDPEIALSRISRPLDRMERKGMDFHRGVRQGFLSGARLLAERYSRDTVVVDASRSMEKVAEEIQAAVFSRLERRGILPPGRSSGDSRP